MQRIGRTGRKRDGYVHVLLSEEREERNWEKADDSYKDVQRFIVQAEHLELYEDVERLIPDHIKPECIEMEMEIEEYVREDLRAKKDSLLSVPKGKKRGRNEDAMRNIPDGASTGFVIAKYLLPKGRKKKKSPAPVDFEHAAESDNEDKEIEAGILGPRRTVSLSAAARPKAKKMRRTTTIATEGASSSKKTTKKSRKKKLPALEDLTPSDLDRLGQDDSDDEAIELGVNAATLPKAKGYKRKQASPPMPPRKRLLSPSPTSEPGPSRKTNGKESVAIPEPTTPPQWSSSPARPLADASIIDLTTPNPQTPLSLPPSSPLAPRWSSPDRVVSSPKQRRKSHSSVGSPASAPARSLSISSHSVTGEREISEAVNDESMAWLLDDDDDEDVNILVIGSSPPPDRINREPSPAKLNDSEVEVIEEYQLSSPLSTRLPSTPPPRAADIPDTKEFQRNQDDDEQAMPPPPLPARFSEPRIASPDPLEMDIVLEDDAEPELNDEPSSDAFPTATFAVRGPGKQSKKRVRIEPAVDSSPPAMPPPSQRRLHRIDSRLPSPRNRYSPSSEPQPSESQPQPPKRKKRKFADAVDVQRHNPWVDVEAAHSGDELSQGSDGDAYDNSMLASEGDEQFAGNFQPTQASPSYDQSAVYRRSLMTQAPGGSMPAFANRPVRRGLFKAPQRPVQRRRAELSSSPPPAGSEDDYHLGTFVVPDDAEISYANDSSILSDS